jgi:uncharacterized phage protein (TIGR01671 family)
MRIKLRIWDGEFGQMCQVSCIHWNDEQPITKVEAHGLTSSFGYRDIKVTDESALLQYCNMSDKNGTDIYRGYLLNVVKDYEHPSGRVLKAGIYLVQALGGEFGISRPEGWWSLNDFPFGNPDHGKIDEVEVVGNYYENKDMLHK